MKKLYANNDPTKYALVDDDVYGTIHKMKLKFCVRKDGRFLSTTRIKLSCMEKKRHLLLHRFIWILKTREEPTRTVDHIYRQPANNQFENLRLATRQEQLQNRGKRNDNTSGYIGVSHQHQIIKYKNKKYENDYWIMSIKNQNGKAKTKRFPFTDEGKLAAARWYDSKAREYYGEFHGQLNFPDDQNKTA